MTGHMTIATVEPRHLLVPLAQPMPASAARPLTAALSVHLVRVTADDGSVAWGEGWWHDAGEMDEALELLTPIVVGADPLDRGALWERMVDRLTGLKQPPPGGAAALSGIDIALWDLAGRAAGMPVYRMLAGGASRGSTPTPPASTSRNPRSRPGRPERCYAAASTR